jgi:hypothetical protein
MMTDTSNGAKNPEPSPAGRSRVLQVYFLTIFIPALIIFIYLSSTEPIVTIGNGFTVGVLALSYWSSTQSAPNHRNELTFSVLTHPLTRIGYIVLGAVGIAIGLLTGVNHLQSLLIVSSIFVFSGAVLYWLLVSRLP